MMRNDFRQKESVSAAPSPVWQNCLLRCSVRSWWVPAGAKSVCKSSSRKILIISLESKSLMMTWQWIAAMKLSQWHPDTPHNDEQHKRTFQKLMLVLFAFSTFLSALSGVKINLTNKQTKNTFVNNAGHFK